MIVDAQDIKDEDLLCMAINSSLGLSLISTLSPQFFDIKSINVLPLSQLETLNLLPSKMFDDMKFA